MQCEDICRDPIVEVVVSFQFSRKKNLKTLTNQPSTVCFKVGKEGEMGFSCLVLQFYSTCFFFFFLNADFVSERFSHCVFFPASSASGLMAMSRVQQYVYPCFEEVGSFWYFTIRTNGYFPHCVITHFIDIKKSHWMWQVFTCPDAASSLLSLIFSRHTTPFLGEALIPTTAVLLPQLCILPLPSFLVELWQPVIVCPSGYYSCNLLTGMLADPKAFFFKLFSLCFLPSANPEACSTVPELESAKVSLLEFLCGG